MAGKGNVTIKIDGDAAPLKKTLNEVKSETQKAASEMQKTSAKTKEVAKANDEVAKSAQEAGKAQEEQAKAVEKAVEKVVDVIEEVAQTQGKTGDTFDDMGDSAKEASRDVEQLGEAAEEAGEKAKNSGKSIGMGLADIKAGVDMAMQAVKAIAEIAGKGIAYNASIEQLQTSFEVMTGSAEKAAEVVDRLRTMGAETPFEMIDLAGTTQLLMQYGFTADEAINRMSMLGDIAQGNTEAMTSIAMGYAQMSSAGKVNLQDIKQMINGGFNPLQEISERTGESMESLYERISKGTMSVDEITQSMIHATSEGGKYFQSMEKQSQTLNGQLSTLKDNADQLLGSLTEGVSNGLRDQILPFANNLIGELQAAFDAGGYQGLVNTATDMIPDLMGMLTTSLQSGIEGLTKWLPKGASKIMQALPSVLRGAASAAPQITTALFEVAGMVVQNLVGMLPELAPVILDGFSGLLGSIITGAAGMTESLFNGIEQMFHQGQSKIAGTWVDDENVAKYTFDIETDVTPAENAIESAYKQIRLALSTDLLTSDQQAEIESMIGEDYETIKAKLMSFGLSDGDASAIASQITSAGETIKNGIGELDITVDAGTVMKWINQAKGSRLMLKNILLTSGLSESDQAEVIAYFDTMTGNIADGTPNIIEEIYNTLTDGKADTTETVDGLKSTVSSYVNELVSAVDAEYQKRNDALDKSSADYTTKKAELDAWYESTKNDIVSLNTEAETLITELANAPAAVVQARLNEFADLERRFFEVETRIEGLTEQARSAGEIAYNVVRSGAQADEQTVSQAVSFVVTDFKLDEQAVEDAYDATVAELNEQLSKKEITTEEYDTRIASAEETRKAGIEAATAGFNEAMSDIFRGIAESEGASAALDDALKAQEAKMDLQAFMDNMIIDGTNEINMDAFNTMTESVGTALGEAMNTDALMEYLNAGDIGGALGILEGYQSQIESMSTDAISTALGGKIGEVWQAALDNNVFTGTGLDVSGTEAQMMALFNTMNFEPAGDNISAGVGTGMENHDFAAAAGGVAANIVKSLNTKLQINSPAKAMKPVGTNSAAGIGEGMAEYDFGGDVSAMVSNMQSVAGSRLSSGGKTTGGYFASGLASGIRSGRSRVVSAAVEVVKAAIRAANAEAKIQSPSRVMMESGRYFSEGFAIGIENSMGKAVAAAKRMTNQAIGAADMANVMRVANMPNLQQEIINANEQSRTPVYLDGVQIAEIQGYNNSTQLQWRNDRAAKGVGSR